MLVMLTEFAAFSSPTVMLCLHAIFNVIFFKKACFYNFPPHIAVPIKNVIGCFVLVPVLSSQM
jgi:hypothetical protein